MRKREYRHHVKDWRLANKLTQAQLADRIRVQRATYANWELGETKEMHPKNMEKLREIVGFGESDYIDQVPTDRKGPFELLAAQMYVMAEILESPDFSPEVRAKKLTSFVESLRDGLDELVIAAKKIKKESEVK